MKFEVSIVIPVKNGLKWLKYSIPKMLNQKGVSKMEIILIDSESDDGLEEYLDYLCDSRLRYFQINSKDFGHGKTRNLGVRLSSHDLVVFTVQDASPVNDTWLISLLKPLMENKLDALCGKQVVMDHKSKNPIEWFRPIENPDIRIINITFERYKRLDSISKKSITGWDNVNAAYKKSVLIKLPFLDVSFGEDAYWAHEALLDNLKIGYSDFSMVDHYHHYSKNQFFERYLAEFRLNYELYGLKPKKKKMKLKIIVGWIFQMYKLRISIFDMPYWMVYNLRNILSHNYCVKYFLNLNENQILNLKNNPLSTSSYK